MYKNNQLYSMRNIHFWWVVWLSSCLEVSTKLYNCASVLYNSRVYKFYNFGSWKFSYETPKNILHTCKKWERGNYHIETYLLSIQDQKKKKRKKSRPPSSLWLIHLKQLEQTNSGSLKQIPVSTYQIITFGMHDKYFMTFE